MYYGGYILKENYSINSSTSVWKCLIAKNRTFTRLHWSDIPFWLNSERRDKLTYFSTFPLLFRSSRWHLWLYLVTVICSRLVVSLSRRYMREERSMRGRRKRVALRLGIAGNSWEPARSYLCESHLFSGNQQTTSMNTHQPNSTCTSTVVGTGTWYTKALCREYGLYII